MYRNFPGLATFGRSAVRYMTEIFREAGVSPKRVVVMYSNDLFGKNQSAGLESAVKTHPTLAFEIVEMIPYPEAAVDLSTEVARVKALKPDITAPVTRPVTAILLLETRSHRWSGPETPPSGNSCFLVRSIEPWRAGRMVPPGGFEGLWTAQVPGIVRRRAA